MAAPETPIPAAELARRTDLLHQRMAARDVGCVLIHSPAAIHYFSGFETVSTGTYACCIVSQRRDPTLVVWELELAGALRTSPLRPIATYPTGDDPVRQTCAEARRHVSPGETVAVELDTAALPPRAYAAIGHGLDRAELADAGPLVADVRRVKSAFEIACTRAAARITDIAMRAAIEAATAGGTDNAIAAAAAAAMLGNGSEYSCMPPIVSAGAQSGIAHSTFRNLSLRPGDAVLVELGACVRRSCAPLMRTIAIGAVPDAVRQLHDAARDVLAEALAQIRPGRSANDVAEAVWRRMPTAFPDLVFHGVFGYAVGSGFPPSWADGTMRICRGNPQPIEPGMVLHLPIAFRRPGTAGVAVSETIVVGAEGVEILGALPRALAVR